jgi:hypothetical protein
MSVGFSILSIGEEHNKELNDLLPSLGDNSVYIYTDSKLEYNKNHHIIFNEGVFNFNQKVYAIEQSLKDNNVVVCLDTDISIRNELSIDKLNTLETGIYVPWVGKSQMYKNKRTSIYQLFKNDGDDELIEYVKSLIPYGANENNLYFFDEFFFVISINDNELKTKFIETWKKIYSETKDSHPTDRHENNLKGACESLIISLTCDLCGINLIDKNTIVSNQLTHVTHNSKIPQRKSIL